MTSQEVIDFIVERIGQETEDGTTYKLSGICEEVRMVESGFRAEFYQTKSYVRALKTSAISQAFITLVTCFDTFSQNCVANCVAN